VQKGMDLTNITIALRNMVEEKELGNVLLAHKTVEC
jgi:hypothetical protein